MPAIRRASVAQPKIEKHHAARVRREGQGWSLPADSSSVLARLPKRLACRHHCGMTSRQKLCGPILCCHVHERHDCNHAVRGGDGERLIIPRFHTFVFAITIICPNPTVFKQRRHVFATRATARQTDNETCPPSQPSLPALYRLCWRSLSPKMRRRSESTGGLAGGFAE